MKLVNREGQSLVEVLIGLAIGALLIGTAALGVAFTLRSSTATQNLRSGSELSQELLDKVRSFAGANWLNIYNLTKGTSTQYFLNASGSDFIAVQGKESKLDNDVLSGLVAHWKFDEVETSTSTTTYDASGLNNTGSLVGGPTRATSTCKFSYCLMLNGTSQYVNVPTLNSFPSSVITVSAWIKITSHFNWHNYVWHNWAGTAGAWLLYSDSSGNARFGVIDNSLVQHNSAGCTAAFTTGDWHMITGVYDGSIVKSYLDGVQCATTNSLAGQSLYTAGTVTIGTHTAGGTTEYVDDVRIYNRALSSDEIKRLYQSSVFTRYFSVENVCRTNDASSTISGAAPCAGSDIDDPSTQKITVKTEWTTQAGKLAEVKLIDFITRWQNRVLRQTDWSQGVGPAGPIIDPTGQYSSSSNIDATSTPGSIQIKELTPT